MKWKSWHRVKADALWRDIWFPVNLDGNNLAVNHTDIYLMKYTQDMAAMLLSQQHFTACTLADTVDSNRPLSWKESKLVPHKLDLMFILYECAWYTKQTSSTMTKFHRLLRKTTNVWNTFIFLSHVNMIFNINYRFHINIQLPWRCHENINQLT